MRTRLLLATLIIAAAAPAAQAQPADPERGGIRTETMERMASGRDKNLPFNLVGILGLLGLLGLRRGHAEDSYHPAAME
jgi:hypothetical protein